MKKGDILSGFTLSEIDTGKVVLVRGEERITVSISDSHKLKKKGALGDAGTQPPKKSPKVQASDLLPKSEPVIPGPQVKEKDRKIFDILDRIRK
jgi:hypothetical protein